jgi:hyperosmotically inducible periplasmic protein
MKHHLYRLAVWSALLLPVALPAQNALAQPADGAGLTAVSNPSGTPDKTLVRQVQHSLARTNGLDPEHIYVEVQNGQVTLTGTAVSEHQLELAGQVTRGVAGVTSISNELTIRAPGRMSD